MVGLEDIERQIAHVAESNSSSTTASLQQLLSLHIQRAVALEKEANEARKSVEVLRAALGVLERSNAALPLLRGEKTSSNRAFGELHAWECALYVLRENGSPMTAHSLAKRCIELGKNLGKQSTAAMTNALKRYVDKDELFYRVKTGDCYVYGLIEWTKGGEKARD